MLIHETYQQLWQVVITILVSVRSPVTTFQNLAKLNKLQSENSDQYWLAGLWV